jgi:hypothetical protein
MISTLNLTTNSDAALLIALKLQNEFKQFTKSTYSVDKMLVTNVNGRKHKQEVRVDGVVMLK